MWVHIDILLGREARQERLLAHLLEIARLLSNVMLVLMVNSLTLDLLFKTGSMDMLMGPTTRSRVCAS